MFAYENQPKTQEEILAEKEQQEYELHLRNYINLTLQCIENLKRGTQSHLFFGHGATQADFVKRDFGTSNQLFYEKKMKTETLINPHFYHGKSWSLSSMKHAQ